jgi:fatty acid desaturase
MSRRGRPGARKCCGTIVAVLGILWLLGFSFHIGGGLIHLLLVLGLIVLILNFFSGRRYA